MIRGYINQFNDKEVVEFTLETKVDTTKVYRLRTDMEGPDMSELTNAFLAQDQIAELEELVIGWWTNEEGEPEMGPEEATEPLIAKKDKLPNLKHLVLGDIPSRDNEMSWICIGEIQPLLEAFPNLEYFKVRAGNGPDFGKINLEKLHTFIYETSGLIDVSEIFGGNMPNLEHLQIWMGTENYGLSVKAADFETLLQGTVFPKLKYLGLNNSEIINEITPMLMNAPILDRIETLDLSGGTLRDEGAQFLLDNPKIKELKHLSLRHHFLSEEMEAKLREMMGDRVNLAENKVKKQHRPDYYFTEVSE